jgi:hypothetical protein
METLQRTANRGSISTGYDIDNSLKLEADNTEYLYKTNDAGTNRKTFTVSMWFKRTELADDYMTLWQGGANGEATRLGFYGGTPKEAIWVDIGGGTGNTGTLYRSYSNQVLRDTSAFYHIVLAVDTTQATEANRFRLWLNGEEVTSWSQRQYPVQDFECAVEASANMNWGAYDATYYKMCGYIAECHYLDGVTAVQTDFGEYDEDSGIWKPKAYAGSYGDNGCYLNFDDSASLGADSSGNGNTFTLNNITSADQATDTPTNNFTTWNVLDVTRTNTQGVDMVEGAMSIKHRSSNGWTGTCSTMAVSNGKWYWEGEVRVTNGGSMWGVYPVATRQANVFFDTYIGAGESGGYDSGAAFYDNDDGYYHDNTFTACTISGSTFNTQTGDVVMIAVDMDNNKLYAGVNGNWCNSSNNTLPNATGITLSDEPHFLATATYDANTTNSYNLGGFTTDTISSAATDANGYGTFEYAPPSGYYAICTKNLAEFG